MSWLDTLPVVDSVANRGRERIFKAYGFFERQNAAFEADQERKAAAREAAIREQSKQFNSARLRGVARKRTESDKQQRLDSIQVASEQLRDQLSSTQTITQAMINKQIGSGGTWARGIMDQAREKQRWKYRQDAQADVVGLGQDNAIWNQTHAEGIKAGTETARMVFGEQPKHIQNRLILATEERLITDDLYKHAQTIDEWEYVMLRDAELERFQDETQAMVEGTWVDERPEAQVPIMSWKDIPEGELSWFAKKAFEIRDLMMAKSPRQDSGGMVGINAEELREQIPEQPKSAQDFIASITTPVEFDDKIWRSASTGKTITDEELREKFPEGYEAGLDDYTLTREAAFQYPLIVEVIAKGIGKLPEQWGASALQGMMSSDGSTVVDKGWEQRFIADAAEDINKFTEEITIKQGQTTLPLKLSDLAQLPQNLGFSGVGMSAYAATAIPLSFLLGKTPLAPAAPKIAHAAGAAMSGVAAYRMSKYQIMQSYLEVMDEEARQTTGAGITQAQEDVLKADFEEYAHKYGLWEAIPEAIGNLSTATIIMNPIKGFLGKNLAGKMALKLGQLYGVEMATETITQKGQAGIEEEAGLREEGITWMEALKEIAPQTFLITTVTAGAGKAMVGVAGIKNKIKASLDKEVTDPEQKAMLREHLSAIVDEKTGEIILPSDAELEVVDIEQTTEPAAVEKTEDVVAATTPVTAAVNLDDKTKWTKVKKAVTDEDVPGMLDKGGRMDGDTGIWYVPKVKPETKATTSTEAVREQEEKRRKATEEAHSINRSWIPPQGTSMETLTTPIITPEPLRPLDTKIEESKVDTAFPTGTRTPQQFADYIKGMVDKSRHVWYRMTNVASKIMFDLEDAGYDVTQLDEAINNLDLYNQWGGSSDMIAAMEGIVGEGNVSTQEKVAADNIQEDKLWYAIIDAMANVQKTATTKPTTSTEAAKPTEQALRAGNEALPAGETTTQPTPATAKEEVGAQALGIEVAKKTNISYVPFGSAVAKEIKISPQNVREVQGYVFAETTAKLAGGNFRDLYVWEEGRWRFIENKRGARPYSKADISRAVQNLNLEQTAQPTTTTTQPETTSMTGMETGTSAEFEGTTASTENIISSMSEYESYQTEEAAKPTRAIAQEAKTEAKLAMEPVKKINKLAEDYRTKMQTHDQTKASLIDFVTANLSKEIQGKMMKGIKRVVTDKSLSVQIARAKAYAEEDLRGKLRQNIIKTLDKVSTPEVRGIKRGTIGIEGHRTIDWVKGHINMLRATVQKSMSMNKYQMENRTDPEGKAWEKDRTQEELSLANERLSMVGIKGMSIEELTATQQTLNDIITKGRSEYQAYREAIKTKRDKIRGAVIEVLTGKQPLPHLSQAISELDKAMKPKWGAAIENMVNAQYNFSSYMEKMSKFDKSDPYSSFMSTWGMDLISQAENAESHGKGETLANLVAKITTIKTFKSLAAFNSYLSKLSKEEVTLPKREDANGVPVELTFTRAELMERYLQLDQAYLDATFRETMAYTDEMIADVRNELTEEEKGIADAVRRFYGEYYEKVNKVYSKVYGIDLPRWENYMPVSRDLDNINDETLNLLNDVYRKASATNSRMKTRKSSRAKVKKVDIFSLTSNHIQQMEHFMAWAEPLAEMKSVFWNPEVRNAAYQFHGENIMRHVDRLIEDLTRGGVEKAQVSRSIDVVRRQFTRSVLAKPVVGLKQVFSGAAYMTQIPVTDWARGSASFWSDAPANYKKMIEGSEYLRDRFKHGYEQNVRYTKTGTPSTTISGYVRKRDKSLWLNQQGDRFGVMPGFYAVYTYNMKGKADTEINKAAAIKAAEQATKRTQPGFSLANLSTWQRGNSMTKLMLMFQNQPAQYFRIFADAQRNMQYGRGSARKNALNMALAAVILPMIFQFVSDGIKWDWEKQIERALFGVPNELLGIGQVVHAIYGQATDMPFQYQPTPVVSVITDTGRFADYAARVIGQAVDPSVAIDKEYVIKMLEYMALAAGKVTGIPTPYVVQVERAIKDKNPRQLIWTRFTEEANAPKAPAKASVPNWRV